jgi:hypothetical protein
MNNLADFEVRFVIGEKLFPVGEALKKDVRTHKAVPIIKLN